MRRSDPHPHHPFYDSPQWRTMRLQQLAAEPYCVFCLRLGHYTRAKVVDHIKPHRGSASLFFAMRNLQSLCVGCHNRLKAAIERSKRHVGCGLNGRPRSSQHHWNRRQAVGK